MATIAIPGLGALPLSNRPVQSHDVVLGGLAGLAGIATVKWVANKFLVGKIPEIVLKLTPIIGGTVAGVALYFGMKKSAKAYSLAVGAFSAGLALNAMAFVKEKYPEFADVVDLRLGGLIVRDPAMSAMNGLIVRDPAMAMQGYDDNPALAELAAMHDYADDSSVDSLLN